MALADPLSRLCSPSGGLYDVNLPAKLATLLRHLPDEVRNAKTVRVHTNKDTAEAARIVQKWRIPTNPISQTQVTSPTKADFIIERTDRERDSTLDGIFTANFFSGRNKAFYSRTVVA